MHPTYVRRSAAQTQVLAEGGPYTWALQVDISSVGPYSLIAGALTMGSASTPGASSTASVGLTVDVGQATVNVSVALGGSASASGPRVEVTDGLCGG